MNSIEQPSRGKFQTWYRHYSNKHFKKMTNNIFSSPALYHNPSLIYMHLGYIVLNINTSLDGLSLFEIHHQCIQPLTRRSRQKVCDSLQRMEYLSFAALETRIFCHWFFVCFGIHNNKSRNIYRTEHSN